MEIFIGIVITLCIIAISLFEIHLRIKAKNKVAGYENQQRFYDKNHKHNWNTSKIVSYFKFLGRWKSK